MEAHRDGACLRRLAIPDPYADTKRQLDRIWTMNDSQTAAGPIRRRKTDASDDAEESPVRHAAERSSRDGRPVLERARRLFRASATARACARTSPTRWPKPSEAAESFSPGERAMLNNILRFARSGRGRDGAARRYRGGRDQHDARRPDGHFRGVRPFAHAGLCRDARRSARHGPHPRRRRPHHRAGRAAASRAGRREKPAAGAARPRPTSISTQTIGELDLSAPCCSCRPRCSRPI